MSWRHLSEAPLFVSLTFRNVSESRRHVSPVFGHVSPALGHVSPAFGHVSPAFEHVSWSRGHVSQTRPHVSARRRHMRKPRPQVWVALPATRYEVALNHFFSFLPAHSGPSSRFHQEVKILLVEDHDDTREVLASLLVYCGYDVSTAANVQDALTLIGRFRFEIMLCDIGLPDGSGLELVAEAKKR